MHAARQRRRPTMEYGRPPRMHAHHAHISYDLSRVIPVQAHWRGVAKYVRTYSRQVRVHWVSGQLRLFLHLIIFLFNAMFDTPSPFIFYCKHFEEIYVNF